MNGELKSIWDEWEKQAFYHYYDYLTGASCALGFLTEWGTYKPRLPVPQIRETFARVARYIQAHYDLPAEYTHPHTSPVDLVWHPRTELQGAIVYANNELKLTPEDFRRIDRETQLEEITRPLIESAQDVLPDIPTPELAVEVEGA